MAVSDTEIGQFWVLMRKANSLADRSGEALFRERLGVTLAQFLVLSVVDARPGAFNQQSVADYLGLTKGTVSRQIDSAQKAGLLTTAASPSSRRDKIVTLTAAGTALVRRGDGLVAESQRQAFATLDDDDFRAAIRTLAAFVPRLDA